MSAHSTPSVFSIPRALLIAGLLLGAALALRLLSPEYLSAEFSARLLGALLGGVVVLYANAVPKLLGPLMQVGGDAAAEQALRRFTGWSLALGGCGYVVAWLVAPLDHAALIATGLLGAATLAVVFRIAWRVVRRPAR